MKNKPLQHDMFLYEFAVRMLGVLATILFSLLFFYGAVASEKSESPAPKENKATTVKSILIQESNEFVPLGDMH